MDILFLLGKIIFGGYFIYNAYGHFANLDALTGYAQSKKVPMPKTAVIITGIMLLIGGVSIISGQYVFIGLWLLIIFLVVTSILMHPFWKLADDMQLKMSEKINFTKNMALVGALLMLAAIVR